ncbi:DUF7064 domain-containing protein [Tepidiforma thermophila]|uniref:Uncharacterized protein n=1 Tax=Tepidiforma thermophila (strain KCTC 52669 / CGMCC 1.13589 / G233) TaxID=2761530 RepID=A0A2A9HFT7_TEPT2|nr:hypothetical protein [Tepidiforma thermophila]PFG74897.1 hypothetical protein A9A59_2146 [Tepidiforma thermophila]
MVTIVGNVKPEDDYTHPLGPEENFNESVYFNFFDRRQQMGGFLRIGNRANEGYAEVTVIVYQPDGSALFNYKRPQISSNDEWNAGGLKVEVLVPGERLRTTYEGSVVYLKDPREMREPSVAFKENPHKRIRLDLVHEGVGPIYGHVAEPGGAGAQNEFARAHYEQHMRVTGTLQVEDGPVLQITGHGLRDHSWGPRYWQSTPSYRWITGNFGDDLGMVLSIVGDRVGGVFHKGPDTIIPVKQIDLETEYEENTNYHKALRATVTLANGETHRVEGTVRGFIPLRNRRAGKFTHIGEGMTEYLLDGERKGYGLSEYLDQVE